MPTSQLSNCDNCGACCMAQTTPPGYVAVLYDYRSWPDEEDKERCQEMPREARAAILDRMADLDGDQPCCWLDEDTLRCRWYEWRPNICRVFEVGSEGCQMWRDEFNVDVEQLGNIGPA